MRRILDTHIHCSTYRDDSLIPYARLNKLNYSLDGLLALMETHGVEAGLLLSPPLKKGGTVPNKHILNLCERSNDKLFPVLTVQPSSKSVAETIEVAKRNRGYVKAFKIMLGYAEVYPDDAIFHDLYDYAESQELPVMFHTGDMVEKGSLSYAHPLNLDRLASRRDDMKMIACHFGNPWIMETAELLYLHPNVFADISGLITGASSAYSKQYRDYLAKRLSEAVYYMGNAEKVLFGTDYPVESYRSGLALARSMKIRSGDLRKILHDNAARVFSL